MALYSACASCLLLLPVIAEAQRAGDTEAFRLAFQETLQKPTDAPTLLKYARPRRAGRRPRGRVSAYERFLMIDPDQPRVRYELGVLYYRLRSYEAARAYFETARASPKAAST